MTTAGYLRVGALSLLIILMGAILHSCGGGDGIDDCSRRGKPQRHDGEKWTCK